MTKVSLQSLSEICLLLFNGKMVMRTRHIIMNIHTLTVLLKFCVHFGYLKKVIIKEFRQFMYIRFAEIKYKSFIICSKSSPVSQLQIYYLSKSFNSEQQRCSDRLHALYSWVLRFVPVSCNRQNVTYVSCSAANRNIQCCFTMLLYTAQSRPHHCVCISKAITTQQKRYNACYSLWFPAVIIYSVQLSVHIAYCDK